VGHQVRRRSVHFRKDPESFRGLSTRFHKFGHIFFTSLSIETSNGRSPAGTSLAAETSARPFFYIQRFAPKFLEGPEGSTNGLTIVFLCATGKHGEDIFDLSLPPRRADYLTYHSRAIANYSDSYWSRNTGEESVTNRVRKNPGFALVAEGPSLTTGPTSVTHHVRILKNGAHLEVEINGHVTIKWDDPEKPLGAGRIGLRSMDGVTVVSYTSRCGGWGPVVSDVRPTSCILRGHALPW
jgi:hypothetical protein